MNNGFPRRSLPYQETGEYVRVRRPANVKALRTAYNYFEKQSSVRSPSQKSPELHGYIKAENKAQLADRLDRIEGQARGIKRMVQREAYCIDTLTQITSLIAASEKVATILLQDHLDQCVRDAVERNEDVEEKIAEVRAA